MNYFSRSKQNQIAARVAASLPVGSLEAIIDFVVNEQIPGDYRIAGVAVKAVDSARYPGRCLDGFVFNGAPVHIDAMDAFYDKAVEILNQYYERNPRPAQASAPYESDWEPDFSDLFSEV